jgi:hypothetical protein
MTKSKLFGISAAMLGALALAGCAENKSDASYCGVARAGHDNALKEVNINLGRYTGCIGRSKSGGDCEVEFGGLRAAQTDLETSASDMAQYCPKGQ